MLAQEESRRLGHNFVGTEQILLGLIGEGTGIAAKTLKSLGVNLKDARMQTEKIIGRGSGFVAVEIPYTPRAKRVLDFSWDEARRLGHSYVGTEHLLLGLVQEGEGVAARVLENLGVDLRKVRGHVIRLLDETGRQNTTAGANLANATIERTARLDATATSGGQPTTPMLDQYCINLTQAAQDNKWEAIVGRKQETERIIQILGRYAKNNVILVGEAGVGKTEIARGLATAIADGDVPEMLLEQRMLMLNLGSLAAESNSQSELEDRFKKIMTEVGKTSNLLFVIDEFQMLWQEANLYKESPLARIFKKALSNENCLFIGITNIDVYRQRIEHDAILKNYCQPVIINPMSVQETAEILKRLKERYEQHHNVSITDEAIEQAVILSDEKISERCLPDKAIDLIDEACSWVKLKSTNLPRELTEVKRQLQKIRIEKEQLIRHQDFQKAAVMRQQEAELSEKILEMESAWQEKREKSVVNIEAVEHVLNSWLGR
jgi:ATP-dependent Clp protease ATP-binding subunit ClpC